MTQDRSPGGTVTTGQTTTDLTWSIAANESQAFHCTLTSINVASSMIRYAVATPASPTMVSFRYMQSTTSATAVVGGFLAVQWASTCTGCTPSVTSSVLTTALTTTLDGVILNGSNAGSVTIYFANSATAVTNTLKKGSSCVYWKP